MANALSAARELPNGNILTAKGRMLYPALFEKSLPKGETDPAKAAWQITLLFPKGSDLTAIEKAIEAAITENLTAAKRATTKLKLPLLKTKDQAKFAEFADEYPVMARFNAKKMRPDVVTPKGDRNVGQEEEADEVYSGRWARVSCRPFFFDHELGGKGVSLGLQNVQLLDHDDPIAGGKVKGTAEFEAVGDDDLGDMAA